MPYKIIIYEVVIFNVKQSNRTIKKKYFKKLYTEHNINIQDLSKANIEIGKKYNDFKYIQSILKENEEDNFINKQNEKSERDYKNYIMNKGVN